MANAVSTDELEMQSQDECPMDRYGRYLIVPEGKAKGVAHTRVSTFKGAVEERYGLEKWGKRVVARGVALDDELRMAIASLSADDKKALDRHCETAFDRGGGNQKSTLGTALHTFTERFDRGEKVRPPEPFNHDLDAYEITMKEAGIRHIEIEQHLVIPQYTVAGRADRFSDFGEGTEPFVSDLKSGADLEYSWLGIAIQLALYAHASTIYDPKTQTHRPMPKLRQDKAMVIHLPAGQGRCELWWVDIEAGWAMVPHCARIREWHKVKGLATKHVTAVDDYDIARHRRGLTERIATLKAELPQALAVLAQRWPNVPTLKACAEHSREQLSAIDAVLSTVEAEFEAPF